MATKKPAKPRKKVIDVKSPDEAKASATSRPIIINNHPLAQDPMMANGASGNSASEDSATAPPLATHGKTIMPLSTSEKEDDSGQPGNSDTSGKSAPTASELVSKLEARNAKGKAALSARTSEENASEPDDTSVPEEETVETSENTNGDDADASASEPSENQTSAQPSEPDQTASEAADASDDDQPASEIKTGKSEAKSDSEAATAQKRQAELDELVESGKYFVPINQVRKRHDRYWLALVIIILLAIIVLDLLFDYGTLHISGFTFYTNFFHR